MKLAIYDIDYTIISVNSLLAFYIYLFRKFPSKLIYVPYLFSVIILWLIRIISTDKVKALWLKPLTKFTTDELDSFAEEFVDKIIIPKLKKGVVENIKKDRENGYKIIFASASFEFYIKHIAAKLNADYYFGTRIETVNGKIKNKLNGKNCKGEEKIKRILNIIPEGEIDKENSICYSDSNSDLAFLKLTKFFYKVRMKKWDIVKIIEKK